MKPLTFGQRLKESRRAAKLTQQQAAKRVGMAQGTLSELEGDRYPTSSLTPRLAHIYGVHARWLADGEGPQSAGDQPAVESVQAGERDSWPFAAQREDFEKLRPVDRRALDKTLTAFIAGTLERYRLEEMKRNKTAIQSNETKMHSDNMDTLNAEIAAMEAVAQGSESHGSAKRANSRRRRH